MGKCNMEIFKKGLCDEPAEWKHPRWPGGLFCDGHKRRYKDFFNSEWERIICKKNYNGEVI